MGRLLSGLKQKLRRCMDSRYYRVGIGGNVELGRAVLGGNNAIGDNTRLEGDISLGYATTLERDCLLRGVVRIGNYCQLAPRVAIFSRSHPVSHATTFVSRSLLGGRLKDFQPCEPVEIGHDVWVGHGAVVLKGVKIGHGAVVGAGSVVTRSLPDYAIAAGAPARVIRQRFDEEICRLLLQLQWWRFDAAELARMEDLFTLDFQRERERALALLRMYLDRLGHGTQAP